MAGSRPSEDWLDSVLREDAREHATGYIADEGFTEAVMSRLPEPIGLPAWRRPVLAALWIAVIAVAITVVPSWFDSVFRSTVGLLAGYRITLFELAGIMALFAAVAWSSVLYALRSD